MRLDGIRNLYICAISACDPSLCCADYPVFARAFCTTYDLDKDEELLLSVVLEPRFEKFIRRYRKQGHCALCLRSSTMLLNLLFFSLLALLPLPLSALVIDLGTSLEAASNLTDLPMHCFPPVFKDPHPTNFEDCRDVASFFMSLKPYGRPWVFSTKRDKDVDFVIPLGRRSGSCEVRVLPVEEHDDFKETFTARYFVHQIYRIINQCVIPGPHRGGASEIGPKRALALIVSGPLAPMVGTLNDDVISGQGRTADAVEVL